MDWTLVTRLTRANNYVNNEHRSSLKRNWFLKKRRTTTLGRSKWEKVSQHSLDPRNALEHGGADNCLIDVGSSITIDHERTIRRHETIATAATTAAPPEHSISRTSSLQLDVAANAASRNLCEIDSDETTSLSLNSSIGAKLWIKFRIR
uniref:Uncharacterized protein n=1 Tax=Vespula pensylvanica TaxID=30213 RepID=A0A834PGU7_VESPE|nr:hypothetical protein H0235_001721 [Vespula pensylvanica]